MYIYVCVCMCDFVQYNFCHSALYFLVFVTISVCECYFFVLYRISKSLYLVNKHAYNQFPKNKGITFLLLCMPCTMWN